MTWPQRDCRARGGDGRKGQRLLRQPGEEQGAAAVVARRCSGRGAIENGCTSDKGGGSNGWKWRLATGGSVEAIGKRRRGQWGPARATVAKEQRGSARKRLGSAGGRRNDSARSIGREEAATVGKSSRRWPINGEQRVATRMVDGGEGGRQQRHLGAVGDNDKGLVGGDNGKGWATDVEGWPTVNEERKKGRDAEDNSRVDGGEEAAAGGRGEDAARSDGRKVR
ncbi:hypothetical protein BHE74_00003549 [Ensete ventricosum]|nr:hypothetical protein BHE74_00003549 [Ensete ventricosum]